MQQASPDIAQSWSLERSLIFEHDQGFGSSMHEPYLYSSSDLYVTGLSAAKAITQKVRVFNLA